MDLSKYKELYLQESEAHLKSIEDDLLTLDEGGGDHPLINNLFRHYHSIKGMSAAMGFIPINKLAHLQEDLLGKYRSSESIPPGEVLSALLECLDVMKDLTKKVRDDEELTLDIEPYRVKIEEAVSGKGGGDEAKEAGESAATKAVRKAPLDRKSSPRLEVSNVLKVEGRLFDDLLVTLGDMLMELSTLKSITDSINSIALRENVHAISKSMVDLHESILEARMIPIGDLMAGLPRIVRDLCKESGKEAHLRILGGTRSLDKSILEGVGDPLVHIIRNAVDHGIERGEERIKAGKKAEGSILINATDRGDMVSIEITDDGRGIDKERLKEKVLERGLKRDEELRAMSESEILSLITIPGLSTAEEVTDVSGRGVGMDVAKEVIESLGGSIVIDSTLGKGTKIALSIPRSTSIIKGLVLGVSREHFLIPSEEILKVLEVPSEDTEDGILTYEETTVPIRNIKSIFKISEPTELDILHSPLLMKKKGDMTTVVLVEAGGSGGGRDLVGIEVDNFGTEIDAYIKPLTPPLKNLWGVNGISVMGDGRPVFLLNVEEIRAERNGNE